MKAAIDWINTYLDRPVSRQEAIDALKQAGFPEDGCETVTLSNGQTTEWIDFEVTSNRGDMLCHVGLARELAAVTGRTLKLPNHMQAISDSKIDGLTVKVQAEAQCPLYTARVIRGVKIGPSPDWLVERLESVGQRSINNIVDITNFVLLEYGQPLHAFDLNQIEGGQIIVRMAEEGETMQTLDGQDRKLDANMLVIADAKRPVGLAGVMGGLNSEVTDGTTDILLESAIFAPLTIRWASRKLKLASDASFRFERGMCPWRVAMASLRATELIEELAGGKAEPGLIQAGPDLPSPASIELRTHRVRQILGLDIANAAIAELLDRLNLSPKVVSNNETNGQVLSCTPPSYRLDLLREIDLIEEVARMHGMANVPVDDKLHLRARPPQHNVQAKNRLHQVWFAHGFQEAVTYSFVPEKHGKPFVQSGASAVMIADERRKKEPMLRPSVVPSLLNCRKLNQDAGNANVRLYEIGSAWQQVGGQRIETVQLAWIADAQPKALDTALRQARSLVVDALQTVGKDAAVSQLAVEPANIAGFDTAAQLTLRGQVLGCYGVVEQKVLDTFGLQTPVVAGAVDLNALVALYPPAPGTTRLPRFPGIERDLSVIVDESVTWQNIAESIESTKPDRMVALSFVGIYRGKPIDAGQKSVTFRMVFRDDERTLRHEEVDPQMQAVMDKLAKDCQAQVRQ